MTNIQEVARLAGVSPSTVSNVLNGRTDRMGKETLARVRAAIVTLGFVPNRVARQLKTGHTPLLGLLVPSTANPGYALIAREIENAAQERHGFRVLLCNTARDVGKETSFFDDLLAHGVRGVVIVSSLDDERHAEAAVERGLVVLSYDRRATPGTPTRIDHVSIDSVACARMATELLIRCGHTRIAFATAAGKTMSRSDKIAGFRSAAEQAGLSATARVIEVRTASAYGDAEMVDAGRQLATQLAADPMRPTAVVAVNDMLALGLMAGLRDAGLAVPADVSVIGMDDLFPASLVHPALSTVRSPVADMARTVVERIMARLADPGLPTAETVFQPELIERQSVAPPAV